jgi:hypothetical protein
MYVITINRKQQLKDFCIQKEEYQVLGPFTISINILIQVKTDWIVISLTCFTKITMDVMFDESVYASKRYHSQDFVDCSF